MRLIEAKFGRNNYTFSSPQKESKDSSQTFITVLIGPNASGKSRALSKIADAFRKIHDARTGKHLDSEFSLTFETRGSIQVVDSRNLKSYQQDDLPSSVISVSNSIADKFPLKAKIADGNFYEYIGARDGGYDQEKFSIYSLVDTLQEIGASAKMVRKSKEVFKFLSLEPIIWIKLKTNRRTDSKVYNMLFNDDWSTDQWKEELLNSPIFNRLSSSQKSQITAELNDPAYLHGLREFIEHNRAPIEKDLNSFTLNFNKPKGQETFAKNYKYFTLLRKLSILTYDRIEVKKAGRSLKYNLLDSSSGEVCLLSTFVRTIPHLTDNSLVLIDEPEISLHPNWQLQYIDRLKLLLKGFKNVHVIIATHSPYLVTDVNPESGCVVNIQSSADGIKTDVIPSTPYGWSLDDVLYNVFNVATFRNFNLEMDVRSLLKLTSENSKNKSRISELIQKLDRFEAKADDPLSMILADANKYIRTL
ncbi:MAG: ATP-binding protein [Proteobacteria bacterium]|nr:ATP-binding protein [Pseudomonadota bacterium]